MSTNKQLLATCLIVIGGVLLIYSMMYDTTSVYIKVVGIIFLMFGLFRATRVWVDDNKKEEEENE
ncbi:hypothetical protein SAMN04488096_104295 [Mesonia phycicola]|uniref:Uncharacterized protein n=1 Tax=Mesonia phycicola TaxID=579105 RepID=A0A1M6E105_9FLAO|nr:hypothetical protein [Mesonia phycicola]SHI79187.1 hypothetical protein SAMN04488096_104295 [Mesonia phycicola]